MRGRVAEAFAPAAISNFFAPGERGHPKRGSDLSRIGATGGGFTLSSGVHSKALVTEGERAGKIRIIVNGDPKYQAHTTLTALRLMLKDTGARFGSLLLEQNVEVPIGYGFGASAASALSGVLAASGALDLNLPKERVARFAHDADILSKTGLGTVSVIYDATGAGAITEAGGPGRAKFVRVRVPNGLKVVTASVAPYNKSAVLGSSKLLERVNKLGLKALEMFLAEKTFDALMGAGEWFSRNLGLETKEVRSLERLALDNGASHASQNMIGQAIHATVETSRLRNLVVKLGSSGLLPWVQVYDVGGAQARVLRFRGASYPTVTSSLV